jgi:TolB-like protein
LRYVFEDYALDTDCRELRRGVDLIPVEPQVFDLLTYLIKNHERVVGRDELFASVWHGRIVSDSALSTRINAARSAIGDNGEAQRLIKTIQRKGLRFVGAVREGQQPSGVVAAGIGAERRAIGLTLPDRPSIAVLPCTNLSGDPNEDYFSDGITEDIITELSRFSELFVIARNSSFQYKGKAVDVRQVGRELGVRYVLEGSIRRSGDWIRISVQLIDALTGTHRWAERYDRQLEDVFAVQDEVARTIVAILAAHVNKAETERTLNKPPETWQAYDYYLRAVDRHASFWSSFKATELYEVRRLLEQSIAFDPNYARAYARLAWTHVTAWLNSLDGDHLNPAALDRAYRRLASRTADPTTASACRPGFCSCSQGASMRRRSPSSRGVALIPISRIALRGCVGVRGTFSVAIGSSNGICDWTRSMCLRRPDFWVSLTICSNSIRRRCPYCENVFPGRRIYAAATSGWPLPMPNWETSKTLGQKQVRS